MIAKCSCNNCGGHIEFEAEGFQPETRAECPHCHMETILFIPPASVPQKQKNKNMTTWLVVGAVVLTTVIAGFFLKQNPPKQPNPVNEKPAAISQEQTKVEIPPSLPKQSNLKPVGGAFGWKLCDYLPQQFKAKPLREGDYASYFPFEPETEWPPFNSFNLEVTPDGRICSVNTTAVIFNGDREGFYTARERVVAVLTGKYGLRGHKQVGGAIEEEYFFGTVEQTAHLQILSSSDNKQLWLEYYDKNLKEIADSAHAAAQANVESKKKAALSKGL